MKKMTAALALALCLLTLLTACGSGDPAADGVTPPAGTRLISPDTADYYLFLSEDWKTDISTGVVAAYYSESDPTNLSLMVFSLGGAEMSYDEYWRSYAGQFEQIYSDYSLEESGETVLGGVSAGKYVYTGKFAEATAAPGETSAETAVSPAAGSYKFMSVVAIRSGNIYILTYSAKADSYDAHLSDFSDVITNFRFKD